MTREEARSVVLEAFDIAQISVEAPASGSLEGVRLDALMLDSLDVMEVCIAMEVRSGVTIIPPELLVCESAEALVQIVVSRAG